MSQLPQKLLEKLPKKMSVFTPSDNWRSFKQRKTVFYCFSFKQTLKNLKIKTQNHNKINYCKYWVLSYLSYRAEKRNKKITSAGIWDKSEQIIN